MSTNAITVTRPAFGSFVRVRGIGAGTGLLSVAMAATGVLVYGFHVLAARSLGPSAYGQIAVLWAAMFLVAVVLFRPLEQAASRTIAHRLACDEEVTTVVRSVGLVFAATLGTVVLAAAAGWGAITDGLFLGNELLTTMLLAGIAAYAASYLVRGLIGGTRWFGGYALGLGADAVVRIVVAAPLVFLASKTVAAAAVVAAGLAGAVTPLVVGRERLRPLLRAGGGERFRPFAAVVFAAPAGMIAVADQLLVNGPPLLITIEGGRGASSRAGLVFAATMLVRAPVYVFQGVAAALLPNLTQLQAERSLATFRAAVAKTARLVIVAGSALIVSTAIAGPQAMRLVYGSDFAAGRAQLVGLAAGAALYLGASTLAQALLAVDAGKAAATGALTAVACFLSLYLLLPGDELTRVAGAFVAAALVELLVLLTAFARCVRRR